MRNATRRCNTCRTRTCGGRGEQVLVDSRFCFGMCKRGRWSMTFVPSCCPEFCCPCLVEAELWVHDAQSAVKAIIMARDNARERMDLLKDADEECEPIYEPVDSAPTRLRMGR